MTTQINFLVDSTKLPAGGTLANPTWLPHPNFSLQQDGVTTVQNGDYTVNIKANEQVILRVVDANGTVTSRLAPYSLLANSFKGEPLSDAIMRDAANRPINIPEFDEQRGGVPYMTYGTDNPQWGTAPQSYQNWKGCPMIAQSLRASNATIYDPFIQFEGSGNVQGVLEYGLVFGVTNDGSNIAYYAFDPKLGINSR
ncbi:hypothetical protein [Polyangium mundeleinium]|uniref:Uncharacterized protein n=1 Tax=Polyangium mundeleinium TaxID=2995306 RepID=A0ABT5EXG7_9BACT|nr:hypothetical protein [Polyangium mundeleinium]MDC0746524.1 hypothetical protein [Polyangium mundeleinium]